MISIVRFIPASHHRKAHTAQPSDPQGPGHALLAELLAEYDRCLEGLFAHRVSLFIRRRGAASGCPGVTVITRR